MQPRFEARALGAGSGVLSPLPAWGWIWQVHLHRKSPCFDPGSEWWHFLGALCLRERGATFCLKKATRWEWAGRGWEFLREPRHLAFVLLGCCPMPSSKDGQRLPGPICLWDELGKWPHLGIPVR